MLSDRCLKIYLMLIRHLIPFLSIVIYSSYFVIVSGFAAPIRHLHTSNICNIQATGLATSTRFGRGTSDSQVHSLQHSVHRHTSLTYDTTLFARSGTLDTTNQSKMIISDLANFIGLSAKVLVSTTAMLLVLISDSWVPLLYIFGGVVNAILSKVIKKILKQPRPAESKKGGYGMPSSHAQALFYFATVVSLLLQRDALATKWQVICSCIGSAAMYLYAVIASRWRVVTKLHSKTQTYVGAFLGTLVAIFFYYLETKSFHMLSLSKSSTIAHMNSLSSSLSVSQILFPSLSLFKIATSTSVASSLLSPLTAEAVTANKYALLDNILSPIIAGLQRAATSGPVPHSLRYAVIIAGALVLYSKEIKKMIRPDNASKSKLKRNE